MNDTNTRPGAHSCPFSHRAEELEVIGLVHGDREGTDLEEEYDRRPVKWRLAGDDGDLAASVFAAHRARKKWDEIWVTHTPPPQDQGESHPGDPNFVPPAEPRVTSGGAR